MSHPSTWTWPWVMALGVAYFAAIYLLAAALGHGIPRCLLARGVGRVLDPRPLAPGQTRREQWASAGSVLVFGLGSVVPWWMVKTGWADVQMQAGAARVALELLALLLWNDVHFYAIHRSLHRWSWLRSVHAQHHASVVVTPWATYAFHPVEALLLGSVLLLPMLVWPFSIQALTILPVLSLTYNTIGHCNYSALRGRWQWLSNARDHHLHHACHRGNYGFLFTFMDRFMGTQLPAHAADGVIAAGLRRAAREPR
jgi:Delta7-sterol 5-desaturase